MSHITPQNRLCSLQDTMRTEAERWRRHGSAHEADALEHYAEMVERIRQQLLEEGKR